MKPPIMRDLLPVSLGEMVEEVERELNMRRSVYARLCADGRMNRRLADRRIDIVAALLARLKAERDAGK